MAEPVDEFVAALRDAGAALTAAAALLDGAVLPDVAFGRLFEAHAVRDAYLGRLPDLVRDFGEAGTVIDHFVHGLEGGHPLIPRQASAS